MPNFNCFYLSIVVVKINYYRCKPIVLSNFLPVTIFGMYGDMCSVVSVTMKSEYELEMK